MKKLFKLLLAAAAAFGAFKIVGTRRQLSPPDEGIWKPVGTEPDDS